MVQQNGWTFGRKGNGYVALWSWRPMQWRTYTDPGIFTHGLTQPFDLVAPGGADDVWFTQVGDATTVRRLRRASAPRCCGAPITVQPRAAVERPAGRLRRELRRPRPRASCTFGTTGAAHREGHRRSPLDTGKRYDNPWALVPFGATQLTIADKAGALQLDFATVDPHRDVDAGALRQGPRAPRPGHPGTGHGHDCDPA